MEEAKPYEGLGPHTAVRNIDLTGYVTDSAIHRAASSGIIDALYRQEMAQKNVDEKLSVYDNLEKHYKVGLPEADEYWFKLLFNWRQGRGNAGLTLPMVSGLSGVNARTIFDKMREGRYGSWSVTYCYDIKAPVMALITRPPQRNVYTRFVGNINFCPSVSDGFQGIDPSFTFSTPIEEVTEAWVKQAELLVNGGTFSRRGGWKVPTEKELEVSKVAARPDFWTTVMGRIWP